MNNSKSGVNKTDESTNVNLSKETYLTTIKEYWKSGKFCDVTIVQEGRKIQAHKMVLSIASAYFRAMFLIDMKEANMDEITIPGMPYITMKKVIDYIYTGEIVITTDNAQSLIMAADYLQIDELVNLCGRCLVKQLDRHNCLSMRQLLVSVNCDKDITDMATIYVTTYFIPISKSIEFIELNIDDIVELLSFNQLYIDNEQDVYDSGKRWLYAKSDRYVYTDRILKCIRLHLLDSSFITSTVSKEFLLYSVSCQELINQVLQYPSNSLKSSTELSFSPLPHRACTTVPGKIVLFQSASNNTVGSFGRMRSKNTMESGIYDPSTRTWSDYHSARFPYSTSSVCMTSYNGQIYIIHGMFISKVDIFDPTTKQITKVSSISQNRVRRGCSAAIVNNKLYLIGGDYKLDNGAATDVICFDMTRKTSKVTTGTLQRKRYRSSVGLGDYLYVCGGYDNIFNQRAWTCVERMNTKTGVWEDIAPMNEERASCGICVYNGKIYVAGGGKSWNKEINTFEVYDPDTNIWTRLPSMKMKRSKLSLVASLDGIYAVAGKASIAEYYSHVDRKWTDVKSFDNITENVASCLLPIHPYKL